MTNQARPAPSEIGPIVGDTREQRIEYLAELADRHVDDKRRAVLSEQELLVVAELLDELQNLTNPDGIARDPWGRVARTMAVRIYDRLGI